MKTFLEEVCDALLQKYGNSLNELCLVFPSKRARVFFERYVQQQIVKTIWAPEYTTINRLMEDLSDLQLIDPMKLIFTLYKCYGRYTQSNESFDSFYFWGETLLSDFDDIDKYHVNAHDLFQNLSSLKEMEDTFTYLDNDQLELIKRFWNTFNTSKISDNQREFIAVWEVLKGIYDELKRSLQDNKLGYEGMIYRNVVEKIDNNTLPVDAYKQFVFIGFNALNKSEHKLFDYLKRHNKALFFWDYDTDYIGNSYHEAGRFLRENIRLYPTNAHVQKPTNTFRSDDKHIQIVGTTGEFEQTKIIPGLLAPLLESSHKTDRTAIVLADEQLLIPVLYNIPSQIYQINVTMGYPLGGTSLYKLLENVLQIMGYVQGNQNKSVHFQLLIPLLTHPFAHYLFKSPQEFHNTLIEKNIQYVSHQYLSDHHTFYALLDAPDSGTISQKLMFLLQEISEKAQNDLSKFELEQMYAVYTQLNRLDAIVKEEGTTFTIKTFLRLLRKIIRSSTVSFVGEPLSGLQVMGILETRALDFDNLIILSLNEGIYPKPSNVPSFIPQNLRRAFGLPTPEHQDAIYAYYFYRLIHRANNVTCCYNADQANSKGEVSRFIRQLQFNPKYNTVDKNVPNYIGINTRDFKAIKKTPEIQEKLMQYTQSGNKYLSPSALNTYLDCSIKFYYRYMLGLKEAEEITEEIDALIFGNILHHTMELIYSDMKQHEITSDTIDQLLKSPARIDDYLQKALAETFIKEDLHQQLKGNNTIVQSVIRKYVLQILEIDKNYAPFTIESLEGYHEKWVPVEFTDQAIQVRIGGKIDRIDANNGRLRIVDYKTGKKKNTFKDIEETFWRSDENRPAAVFQVFLYSYLYTGKRKENVEPHLIFIRDIYSSAYSGQVFQSQNNQRIPVQNYKDVAGEFEENVHKLLQHIYNPDIPFKQTTEEKHCERCEFSRFCWR
ncbi:MAG: hypothetical protein GVY19_08580 [Bacteroidetes bacterium]|jgi:CRISPR/Cas system-associated exonuclease Cas4 (RecB family)|nr:hypothetical protein [Bacteroidota bacterium]